MINLIPPEKRRELRAMRHNSILVRYALISIVFFAVTIFIHFGTYLLLRQAEVTNTAQSESHLKKAVEYEGVYREAQEYTQNLAAAKALFESSVPYPEALSNLAKTLPSGVIIDTVNLEAGIIDQPGTLTAHAVSYEAAVALKDAFANSTIAKDVSISNVTNTSISTTESNSDSASTSSGEGSAPNNYPIQVTLNITFTRELLYPPNGAPETNEAVEGPDPAQAGPIERPVRNSPSTEEAVEADGTGDSAAPNGPQRGNG